MERNSFLLFFTFFYENLSIVTDIEKWRLNKGSVSKGFFLNVFEKDSLCYEFNF